MWLICGLGNPGKKYVLSRHNVGFDVVDSLIDKNNCEEWKKQSKKSVAYHLANKINDLLINYNKRVVNA